MKKNRVYAGIDLDALRYNMESMHKNIKEGTKIAAVIKADAYGHGALTVAKTIEDLPYVWGFAVATADEAEMLIADGRKKPEKNPMRIWCNIRFPRLCIRGKWQSS